MNERYTLYGHDGQGNLKSRQEVSLPSDIKSGEHAFAQAKIMDDPELFYTFVGEDGKAKYSAGPVGWRSKFGERIPEYAP